MPFTSLISDRGQGGTTVLRGEVAKVPTSADGSFTSCALFPFDSERKVEFYKLTIAPHAIEVAVPHQTGTIENLVIAAGHVEVGVTDTIYRLSSDDAILFETDVVHSYRNTGNDTAIL